MTTLRLSKYFIHSLKLYLVVSNLVITSEFANRHEQQEQDDNMDEMEDSEYLPDIPCPTSHSEELEEQTKRYE